MRILLKETTIPIKRKWSKYLICMFNCSNWFHDIPKLFTRFK